MKLLSLVLAISIAGCSPAIPNTKPLDSSKVRCDVTNIYALSSDTLEALKEKVGILNGKVTCLVDLIRLSDIDLNSL